MVSIVVYVPLCGGITSAYNAYLFGGFIAAEIDFRKINCLFARILAQIYVIPSTITIVCFVNFALWKSAVKSCI